MHERNLYTTPPNFADLAKKYDFFAPFLTMDAGGNPKINFKDDAALRALSRALLLRDFGLDVRIPEGVLVPTIPLRLNYILWIEDLLGLMLNVDERPVSGIDIGTGATAIYALLGARKNKWKMTGTEIFPEYSDIAKDNVSKNGLSELITIVQVKSDSVLEEVLLPVEDGHYYFTMCNPPFFSTDEETDSVMKGRFSSEDKPLRSLPSAAKTGRKTELVAEGGELKFVQDIIKESLKFPNKVRIFTTMIGIKRHLKQLTDYLRANGVQNYTTTDFIQGKTMRWGLAWSFYPGIQLLSSQPDLIGMFSNFSTLLNFETIIHSYLSELKLHTLQFVPPITSSSIDVDDQVALEVIATENTWSNQRRKRREMERQMGSSSELSGSPSPPAQKIMKVAVTKGQEDHSLMECDAKNSTVEVCDNNVLVHFLIDFVREESDAKLVMRFREGSLGKDGMNQILQYIKNRYAKDCKDPYSAVGHIMTL